MNRVAGLGLGGLRLLVAAALLFFTAYVLSWRILYGGLSGSDSLFHLDLVSWVDSSFPGIGWWYPWDGNGMPYREGYPLAAHWVTVLLARLDGLGLPAAMQVVQFAVNPLCALGVYVFCAWRLGRPLVGLVAGFLYLLSPIAWTFLLDWGFYSNQVATVLFIPAVFALDVFAEEWREGRRGLRFRASAVAFLVLASLLGMAGPAVVGAALVAVPAYALFQPSRRLAWRWLLLATPALAVGFVLLAAFWALPLQAWLTIVAGRQPPRVYSPDLFHLWTVAQVFQVSPLRVTGNVDIYTRTSLSPAVTLPAIAGLVCAWWDRRLRVFAALLALGLLAMTSQWLYALLYPLPLVGFVLQLRVGAVLLQFLAPILAATGLIALPQAAAAWLLRRRLSGRRLAGAVAAVTLAGLALAAADVAAFSHYLGDSQQRLAYGAYQPDQRDVFGRHLDDQCPSNHSSLCDSVALTASFNVAELIKGCVNRDGALRAEVPICGALGDAKAPAWSGADDPLVASTLGWCAGAGAGDVVCAARYQSLDQQLLDPRPLEAGCLLEACVHRQAGLDLNRTLFENQPQRAALDAQADTLLKAFHYLTGGGQVASYNYQLLPSPELSSWTGDSLLSRPGAGAKSELAAALGIDAIVLSGPQGSLTGDYTALGWEVASPAQPAVGNRPALPAVLVPARATGLAEQRTGRATVLVVGSAQDSPAHPYNDVFEHATEGMVPYASGWLVRGASPYIDDYSDQELAANKALLLLGYRYHEARTAWSRIERYVRSGGSVYVETGWQYVDPDWNISTGFAALPVTGLRWAAVDRQAAVVVDGSPDGGWGSMSYRGGGWGASSAGSVRSGAEPLVSVGGRVLAARWELGSGRLVWSGMNLLAHQDNTGSASEARFLADQWSWLLGGASSGVALQPQWSGDQAALDLEQSPGPVDVLFKESAAPGWSASLVWPGGARSLPIEDAEADFMLVRLDAVPARARLVFTYGPSWPIYASWAVSALGFLALLAWLIAPRALAPVAAALAVAGRRLVARLRGGWGEE